MLIECVLCYGVATEEEVITNGGCCPSCNCCPETGSTVPMHADIIPDRNNYAELCQRDDKDIPSSESTPVLYELPGLATSPTPTQ